MDLLESVKAELLRSNVDHRHPFRFFYLATTGTYPEIRTVVKRDFSQEHWDVVFFTDARSPKVEQIKKQGKVSALFYHPKKQLQLRMKGDAQLIGPEQEAYASYLDRVRQSPAAGDYTALHPPGTEIEKDTEPASGKELHFLAVRILPRYLDVLQLGKEKHTRMAYVRRNGQWQGKKLVP